MGGIRISGSAPPPLLPAGPGFAVDNDDGADEWVDVWVVPNGAGAAIQITSAAPSSTFTVMAKVSPDGQRVAYIDQTSPALGDLRVIDLDGSNDTLLVTVGGSAAIQNYFWLDSTTIIYQLGSGSIRRIDRDGTNAATIKTISNIAGFHLSPVDGQIAYIVNVAAKDQLRVIDPDGTNEATLLSDLLMPFGSLEPVWLADGSAIMFGYDSGVDTIEPDGSNQTNHVVTMPAGYWYADGMGDDRMFYVDKTDATKWKLGQIVFGVGESLVSPTLYLSKAVQRAAPTFVQGRIFVIQDGTLMGGSGLRSLVSVLPDGSDLTSHFDPDESSAPLFQLPLLHF